MQLVATAFGVFLCVFYSDAGDMEMGEFMFFQGSTDQVRQVSISSLIQSTEN